MVREAAISFAEVGLLPVPYGSPSTSLNDPCVVTATGFGFLNVTSTASSPANVTPVIMFSVMLFPRILFASA